MYRMNQKFGIGMVVNVLRGSKEKKIYELGFDELSTYGIIKNYTKDELTEFINILVSYGYLNYKGEFPVLTLNKLSMEIIKGERKVFVKEHVVKKMKLEENELFTVLRELRREIAIEEKIPPYMIFGDATLKELSNRMPTNEEEFLDISGVGNSKLDKYGEIFINKIKDYIDEKNIEVRFIFNKKVAKDSESKIKDKNNKEKEGKIKSYEQTVNLIREGKKLKDIAKERGLALSTIASHIQQYIGNGNEIDFEINFDGLFTEDEEKIILDAIDKVGYNKTKEIKEIIPENISYDAIRAVILKKIANQ